MELTVNWAALGTLAQIISTLAVVLSVVYLARQVEVSNRLARAEASRTPNSDLHSLHASFGTDAVLRTAMQKLVIGASRAEVDPDQRMAVDTSWALYRRYFSSGFVEHFEKQFNLDPSLDATW